MIDLIFVALLQAAAGDPAAAPATTPPEPAAAATPTEETSDDEGIQCRRQAIVGTRLAQRVCTTAAQRREMEEYARSQINRGQSQMWTPPPPPSRPGPMGGS